MDRVEPTVDSLSSDDAMGLPSLSNGGDTSGCSTRNALAGTHLIDSCREHWMETKMHTSMPIMAGRWIREYGEAMPHRVSHHFLYPRQIKQIAGVHMATEASRVRGHQRTARHRLADHIVGMVKANQA